MTSCEPHRTRAYDNDLRWRIIWQTEGLQYSTQQVAKNLNIDKSTVSRVRNRFVTTGTVLKNIYPKEQAIRILTTPVQLLILTLVMQRPGIYLREIQSKLEDMLLLHIGVSTICRFLHENGWTRQKLTLVAIQRDMLARQKYMADISLLHPDMFIFLDETGADNKDIIRHYGYSLRGLPMKKHTLLVRGERISAVAIMSNAGILDVSIMRGTTTGETFSRFVLFNLLPHLQPFNGSNPHSVVVMDNCSIHHVQEVTEIFEEAGVMLLFIPQTLTPLS